MGGGEQDTKRREKERERQRNTHTHTHTHTHTDTHRTSTTRQKGYRRYKVKYDAKTERTTNIRVEISLKYVIQDDFEYINYNTLK